MKGFDEMSYLKDFLKSEIFYHKNLRDKDGTMQKFKKNGAVKLWKTRPKEFKIPVKRGLYQYGYITHENYMDFVALPL